MSLVAEHPNILTSRHQLLMIKAMRTTVKLDDDVLNAAKSLARQQECALGEVLSDLLRKGLAPDRKPAIRGGFPVFAIREDAPPLTAEQVRIALDDFP